MTPREKCAASRGLHQLRPRSLGAGGSDEAAEEMPLPAAEAEEMRQATAVRALVSRAIDRTRRMLQEEQAAERYDKEARRLHGANAQVNFPRAGEAKAAARTTPKGPL